MISINFSVNLKLILHCEHNVEYMQNILQMVHFGPCICLAKKQFTVNQNNVYFCEGHLKRPNKNSHKNEKKKTTV